jgi:PQQ-dependent catabolism-associated CXXCW motif protein
MLNRVSHSFLPQAHDGFSRSILLMSLAAFLTCIAPAAAQEHSTAPVEVAEPADYRMNDYRAPVPKTLSGARVVDAETAEALCRNDGAILIDVYPQAPKPPGLPANTVWRTPKHHSIEGAVWLPNVGYGGLSADAQAYFRSGLERITGGTKDKMLIFFCLRDCWMSWNAAKRAMAWGYTKVVWFPDGTDGWQEFGNTLVEVTPEP